MKTIPMVLLMAGGEGGIGQFLPLILIFVVFYFFMIRPQQKKAKNKKNFQESIAKGNKVVTIGGIHGKVAEVRETAVIIETEGGNRLKVEKTALSMEYSAGGQDEELAQKQ